jgi:hypothetical protein
MREVTHQGEELAVSEQVACQFKAGPLLWRLCAFPWHGRSPIADLDVKRFDAGVEH